MTTVNINKHILSLYISGHAGYAEHGKDIICASASILAYTLIQCMQKMQTEDKLKCIEIDIQDGVISVKCEPEENALAEAQNTFTTICEGYKLLAENYPQFVRLVES
jgi:uncharacterized protein YsxB (DUF464 family)